MDVKTIINAFYRILRRLPRAGQLLALGSLTSLYCAINPPVEKIAPFTPSWQFVELEEKDGKLCYGWHSWSPELSKRISYVPDHYINSRSKPVAGDNVIILYFTKYNDDNLYMCLNHGNSRTQDWYDWIMNDKKNQKRKKMLLSFIFSTSLCLSTYPGLISRLINLVKFT